MPFLLRDQKRDEFDHLEKGSITVVEYEACFHALSRYTKGFRSLLRV